MPVQFVEPTERAYRRMKEALFRPFDLEKWFVVGFAAWISTWSAARSTTGFRVPSSWRRGPAPGASEVFRTGLERFVDIWSNPLWRIGILGGIFAFLLILVVISWVWSRGEFVFLDAVVHDRRAIAAPWRENRDLGNSLFYWRAGFALVTLPLGIGILALVWFTALHGRIPFAVADVAWPVLAAIVVFVWVPLAIASAYVKAFLNHFVVPIMYRDRLLAMAAWGKFLGLFRQRPGAFLLYGLWVLALRVGVAIAVILAFCLTCCVLACVSIVPYLGTVALLPVSYAFRALGPEFLAQFGAEWTIPRDEAPAAPAPPPA